MSNISAQEFLNMLKESHSQQHKIYSTATPPTTLENFPPGISVMEYYVRPQEIQSCSWRVDKYVNHSTPEECACEDIPNHAACVDGYKTIKRDASRSTLENDPNSLIDWCWKNVPDQYREHDLTTKRSWIIGCLNGIRGDHKTV